MKKFYLRLAFLSAACTMSYSQLSAQGCPITQTTGLHGYGCGIGDQIDSYTLDGISASNSGCSTNNYSLFTSPVWNLTIGNSYTWSATTGSGVYDQGLAIWIDLNGDGNFSSNEQVGNSNFALSHSGTITIPFTASPGSNVRMRLRCDYYTNIANTNTTACEIYGSPNYNFYYGETEDYYVNLISPTPCTTTPGANSVVTPTAGICPGESAFINLANTYTVGDISYQWLASTTSSVGPFTPVSGSGSSLMTPTLNTSTWYQVVITCTNTGGSVTATPGMVLVQGTTTNSVPYHEGFEGITSNNRLPNCSWAAANLGSTQLTYVTSADQGRFPRNGSKFASFYYSPAGTKTFYSNGIQLYAGVTYSAGFWWQTEYYGYNNWTDLSLLVGPSQSATGQATIATSNGPAISNVYKLLSNTFTVATDGIYYLGVRATNHTSSYAYYLTWDDLFVTIPCELNAPALVMPATQTICAGESISAVVGGADTYQWAHGPTGAQLDETPLTSMTYSVTGTKTLTGCSVTEVYPVTVNPKPEVGIFANKYAVCPGGSAILTAFGANMYNWTNNAQTAVTVVQPQSTTVYSVVGTNVYGCSAGESVTVTVHSAPFISINGRTSICVGESTELTASGAQSYKYVSPTNFNTSNPVVLSPGSTTSYTITGKDVNGCEAVEIVEIVVDACTGLSESLIAGGVKVFPNPNTGKFMVTAGGEAVVTITDLTGRHIGTFEGTDHIDVDINHLANGVYYVKVRTAQGADVVRIVKE